MPKPSVEINVNAKDNTGGALERIKSGFASLLNPVNMAIAAMASFTAGLVFAIKEGAESERIQAQVSAAIESTGGAAGKTVEQLEKYAHTLQQKTTIDDEAIGSGQAMLLTFTKLRGEGFDRATEALVNMSIALDNGNVTQESMKAHAIQLGKALQDPIAGVTALRRVGVALDDQQKEQIKSMLKAGDAAGAQAIILKELEKEFGKNGETLRATLNGQLNLLKGNLGNIAEDIGMAVIPAITKLTSIFNDFVEAVSKSKAFESFLNGSKKTLVSLQTELRVFSEIAIEIISKPFKFSTYLKLMDELDNALLKSMYKIASHMSNAFMRGLDQITGADGSFQKKIQGLSEFSEKSTLSLEQKIAVIRQDGAKKRAKIGEEEVSKNSAIRTVDLAGHTDTEQKKTKSSKSELDIRLKQWEFYKASIEAKRDFDLTEEIAALQRIKNMTKLSADDRIKIDTMIYDKQKQLRVKNEAEQKTSLDKMSSNSQRFESVQEQINREAEKDIVESLDRQLAARNYTADEAIQLIENVENANKLSIETIDKLEEEKAKIKKTRDAEVAKNQVDLQKWEKDSAITFAQQTSDILVDNEDNKRKRIGRVIEKQLDQLIDAQAAAEIGKATAVAFGASFWTFGASLLALVGQVAAITAAAAAAKSLVHGIFSFHTGGIVGQPANTANTTLQANEVPAVLQKGEMVLTESDQKSLLRIIRSQEKIVQVGNNSQNRTTQVVKIMIDRRQLGQAVLETSALRSYGL